MAQRTSHSQNPHFFFLRISVSTCDNPAHICENLCFVVHLKVKCNVHFLEVKGQISGYRLSV